MAEITISGFAGMDLFFSTNQASNGDGAISQEIAIIVNIAGKDKRNSCDTLK